MQSLVDQRCQHHPVREAVARCPECARHFCRECIVEHNDRVLCANCLRKLAAATPARRFRPGNLLRVVAAFAGATALWLFFYLLGQILLAVPSTFHEGSVWSQPWWEQ